MGDITYIDSRDNEALLRGIQDFIAHSMEFSWNNVTGEFRFFKFFSDDNILLFGRDVLGRKSLCFQVTNEQSNVCLKLSAFPGNTFDSGWTESYCGTFYMLKLNSIEAISTSINAKISTNAPIDLCCKFESSSLELSKLEVFSFYPDDEIRKHQSTILSVFKNVQFIKLESNIFPKFCHLEVPSNKEILSGLIEDFTLQFIKQFEKAMRKILIPLLTTDNGHFAIPILFSGGVDSLMVSIMASIVIPDSQIVLFNVAFDETEESKFEAPDRLTAYKAYDFLNERSRKLYGEARYKLVLINVSKSELISCRQSYICNAIMPSKTVLDDSIGCVLWFASRMKGIEHESSEMIQDNTPFALVGSGSDEQLGGYARFWTIYKTKGIEGVASELHMEVSRIGRRNLGRDDRVGMSNGKMVFAPFLEEPLMEWLNDVPTAIKTGFSISEENKFLLRNALRKLGVPDLLTRSPKRAMQFGSRIAKLENRNERGSDVCERLLL